MRHSLRTLAFLVPFAVLILTAGRSVLAQQTSTGVYYDYTQLYIGDTTRSLLVPRETTAFSQEAPLSLSIPAAMRLLSENKRATYGNTSVTLSDADIARGRAVVYVDPGQRDWFLIIAAEVVYTFTELGLAEVEFVGMDEHPWTRRDVPFPAYVMHAPMWRVLPPNRLAAGLVELHDGTLLDASEFYRRWNAGDRQLIEQLYGYLSGGSLVEKTGVLTVLRDLDLPGTSEAVLGLLEGEEDSIRLLAIEVLARTPNRAVLSALARLIESDASAPVRTAAAAALGQSEDTRYQYYERLHQLQSASEAETPSAIQQLALTGDQRAVDPLVPYIHSPVREIRQAAAEGLIQLNAIDRLFALATNAETPIFARIHLAEILVQSTAGAEQIQAIETLAFLSDGAGAVQLVDQLAAMQDSRLAGNRRQALERLLGHSDPTVRAQVARQLGELGMSDSLTAIARAARAESDRTAGEELANAAAALLLGQPVSQIAEETQSRDPYLRRTAYLALGRIAQQGRGNASIRRTLSDGLADGSAEIRAAAAFGLSGFADGEAFSAIAPLATDPDPLVRRAVARGLGFFPVSIGRETLMALLTDPDSSVIAATVEAFGRRSEPDVLPEVLGLMTASNSAEVRALGATAAGALATPQSAQVVIDALMGLTADPDAEVRAAVAGSLGNFSNELAVIGLSTLTQDTHPQVRSRAIQALPRTGHAAAVGVLTSLLSDPSVEVRIAAYQALAELGMVDAIPAIQRALEAETNPAAQDVARQVIEQLSP
ncbi:MAG: HEAT repeat domain-containing protein [Bradymonadales bacterium]|nr:HEAT repeat domain-containing protein [Bradymonadales bacterium]